MTKKTLKLNAKALFNVIGFEFGKGTFPIRWSAATDKALFTQVRGPRADTATKRIAKELREAGYVVDFTIATTGMHGDVGEIVVALDGPSLAAGVARDTIVALNEVQAAPGRLEKRKPHPACDSFPMMSEEELDELGAKIKRDGLIVDLELWRDPKNVEWLLDGRNREEGCRRAGVTPRYKYYTGNDPVGRVFSLNLARRHMNESQRALAAAKLANLGHGGDRKSDAGGKVTQAQAAKMVNSSERSVQRAQKVLKIASPEVVRAIEDGKMPVKVAADVAKLPIAKQRTIVERVQKSPRETPASRVVALVRQEERRATVKKINTRPMPMPRGPFSRFVCDWPWKYDNAEDEGARATNDYPPLPIEDAYRMADEIKSISAPDAVCFFWVTKDFIEAAYGILRAWGFDTVRSFVVWKKVTKNGKPKVGLGRWVRNETEYFLIASKGNPHHTLNETTTWFEGVARERSRKPEEFWTIYADRVAGAGVELFAREARPGWSAWGAEVDKFTSREAA